MSRLAADVSDAIAALEHSLRRYVEHEHEHQGVPREVSAESILGDCSPWLVTMLLEHLPTLAHPWRVVDMRDGEATRLVRDGYQDVIATVRRVGSGRRGRPRWSAFVGSDVVSPPDVDEHGDAMPIGWSTVEEAQAACDARLRESGVTVLDDRVMSEWPEVRHA